MTEAKTEDEFRALIDSTDEVFVGDCRPFDLALHAAADPVTGERKDVMLQQRQELAALCAFIVARGMTSILEIGFWTGRLSAFLKQHTTIERVYGADLMLAMQEGHALHMPPGSVVFVGDSTSDDFVRWRAGLGHIDLVFIDGDHSFEGCMADWRIALAHPCSAIGVHDTADHFPYTEGVTRAWASIAREATGEGYDVVDLSRPFDELDHPSSACGIGVVEVG